MASVELSGAADQDVAEIYGYLHRQFGPQNAEIYVVSLENCFEWLAQRPVRGKPVDYLRAGYLRFEYAGHTIWYVIIPEGVRIVRVLSARLDPERRI